MSSLEELGFVTVTQKSFEDFTRRKKGAVLMYYAPWCGPCRALIGIIAHFRDSHPEYKDIAFGILNVDDYVELATTHNVTAIPDTFFYRNGEMKGHVIGAVNEARLIQLLQQAASPA